MTRGVIVLGAGGHAKVCVELLRAMQHEVAWCIGTADDAPHCLGVPVLVGEAQLERLAQEGFSQLFVAIGANGVRQRLGDMARRMGFEPVNAISPHAVVSPTARLGHGVAIMAGAVVHAEATVADYAIVNTCASVDHDARIGEAAHLAPHCGLAGSVVVGERAFLGVGCKVIPGMSIGADVVAGAGSVIVSHVAPGARVVGVPARPIRKKTP